MTLKRMLALTAATVTMALGPVAGHAAEEIRVGAILALSGPASFLGGPEEKALRMIVEQMNAKGGIAGHPIKLTVYDTEGNSTNAGQQFRRLAESDKVAVVIGPSTTGESLTIKPIANELKVPVITLAGAEAVVVPPTPYVFKTPPTDRIVAKHMLAYFKEHGIASIGILSSADGFGQTGANMVAELAPAFGVAIKAKEEFGPRDTDMTAQVLKIRESGAAAMLIWSVNPGPTIILRNAKAIGYDKPIFNSYGGATQQLITQAGDAAEGSYVSSMRLLAPAAVPKDDPVHAAVNKLAADYQQKYGDAPPTFAAHTYDAMLILEAAVKKIQGAISRDALAQAIPTVEVAGGNGYFRFSATDHNGLDEKSKPMLMMKVKNGAWVVAN